jgi:hypothetical protein
MKEIKGKFYTMHHLYDDFYTSSMATSKWLPLRLFTHQLHIKVPQTKVGLLLAKDANVSTNNAKLGFIVQIFFTSWYMGCESMHGVWTPIWRHVHVTIAWTLPHSCPREPKLEGSFCLQVHHLRSICIGHHYPISFINFIHLILCT